MVDKATMQKRQRGLKVLAMCQELETFKREDQIFSLNQILRFLEIKPSELRELDELSELEDE